MERRTDSGSVLVYAIELVLAGVLFSAGIWLLDFLCAFLDVLLE
jgi:hypothetical protein